MALFLDTCAILDIIRAANRNKSKDILAANEIIKSVTMNSRSCQIILSSVIYQEYKDHYQNVYNELDAYFKGLNESLHALVNLNNAFGNKCDLTETNENLLRMNIDDLVNSIFDNSICVQDEDRFHIAASHRVIQCTPPASKGRQELKDCLIVEEYLEVCKNIKMQNESLPLMFLSSNTKDYCVAETKEIRRELAKEFNSCGLGYYYSWQHVLSEITKYEAM
jgi:hypothetical protein